MTTFTLPVMIGVACSFAQFDYIVDSVFTHDSHVSKSKELTLLTTLTSFVTNTNGRFKVSDIKLYVHIKVNNESK